MRPARKRFLICLVGIDGSGKTTQARALAAALTDNGFRARYVWNRFEPRLTRPFVAAGRSLFLRGKRADRDYRAYADTKRRVFANSALSMLYRRLSWLDYSLNTMVKVSLPLMLGTGIVCDRYLHDTLVDMAVDFGYSEGQIAHSLKRAARLFPRPDVLFLLDVPAEVSFERKHDTPLELLQQRRAIYQAIGRACAATVLNGLEDRDRLNRVMVNQALQAIRGGDGEH